MVSFSVQNIYDGEMVKGEEKLNEVMCGKIGMNTYKEECRRTRGNEGAKI